MKKLFLTVLALGALASCQNEEGAVVEQSTQKTITITIANGVAETKAVDEVTPDAVGGNATIADQFNHQTPCATTDQLVILFANRAGYVVEARTFAQANDCVGLTAGDTQYYFHNVHESVEQVAVVRHKENGTDVSKYTNEVHLSTFANAAAVENLNAPINDIDLYASSDLTPTDRTHTYNNVEYKIFTATVDVAPALARVEIIGVDCTNLGERTYANVGEGTLTGGYDKLTLKTIEFGANKEYDYTFADNTVLHGVYEPDNYYPARMDRVTYSPGDGKAIAWNIAPQTALTSTNPMVFSMVAEAYDYTVWSDEKTLTITAFNGIDEFERGKIYRLDLKFKEENIDVENDGICVDVTVNIANWVVVNVEPTFGTNEEYNPATPANN